MSDTRKYFRHLIFIIGFVLTLVSCSGGVSQSIDEMKGLAGGTNSEVDDAELLPEEDLQYLLIEHANNRDYAAAHEIIKDLKKHPDYDSRWVIYAEAYIDYATGNYDTAIDAMLSFDPGPYEYTKLELRSYIYNSMGWYEDAYDDAEAVLMTRPWYSPAMDLRWELDLEMGKFDRAREIAALIDNKFMDEGADSQLLLSIYKRRMYERDFDSAETLIERIPNLPSTIAGELSDFYDPGLTLSRAQIAVGRGELERAASMLEVISDQFPNFTDHWSFLTWMGLTAGWHERTAQWAVAGIVRSGGGEGERILSELGYDVPDSLNDDVIASGPMRRADVGKLLIHLAYVELISGDTSTALDIAHKAREINPYEHESWMVESQAHEIDGDTENALRSAAMGLNSAQWNYTLAIRYLELVKRAPSEVESNYPDVDFVGRDFPEMAEGFVLLFPDYPTALTRLGNLDRITGGNDFLNHFARAYELRPFGVDDAFNYAAALAESGDIDQAKEILEVFSTQVNVPWLVELKIRSDEKIEIDEIKSAGLLELFEWLKTKMDPYGDLDIPALNENE